VSHGARASGAALLLSLLSFEPARAAIHVDATAPGANDGSSWENAFTDLQSALAVAAAGDSVFVAGGTYVPGANVTDTFTLPDLVVLLGSFGGWSSADPDHRDLDQTPSILSGEIGSAAREDNCYHVVTAIGTASGTLLDGFVVTRGHAWAASPNNRGAGMYIPNGSLTVRDARFVDNQAADDGAGIYATGELTLEGVEFRDGVTSSFGDGGGLFASGDITLTDCSFFDNAGRLGGGARFSTGTFVLERCVFEGNSGTLGGAMSATLSELTLVDLEFRYNSADEGGALSSNADPLRAVNCLFWRNSAEDNGGAVRLIGGGVTERELTNCTFAENEAFEVGALDAIGTPLLTNCIFWADAGDVGFDETNGGLFSHCIVAGSGGSGAGWDPTFGIDGGGNLDLDPAFEFMVLGNMRLTAGSPAVDAGDPEAPNLPLEDLDGNPRILGAGVDMGAYEFVGPVAAGTLPRGRVELLRAVRPNPTRGEVSITFELTRSSEVGLAIFDVQGRLVRRLVAGKHAPGVHQTTWDGAGSHGRVAAGVYFMRIRAGDVTESRRLVVLR